jgi:hypothetical protein
LRHEKRRLSRRSFSVGGLIFNTSLCLKDDGLAGQPSSIIISRTSGGSDERFLLRLHTRQRN